MSQVYFVIDLAVIVALGVLGLTVLLQNRTLRLNRGFAMFVASISVWILANHISNDTSNTPGTALFADYFVFAFSYASAVLLLQFAIQLSEDKKAHKWFIRMLAPLILIGAASFTPLIVKGVSLQGSVYAVEFGPFLPLYGTALLVVVFFTMYVIHHNMKVAKDIQQQSRLKVLFRSLLLSLPALLIAEFIIPAATGWFGLTDIGILPMLILVFGLYYGVVKHHLFDIRLVAARSLAYLLSIASLALMYGVVVYSFIENFFHMPEASASLRFLYTGIAVLLALTFQPVKHFFDKTTDKIFLRNDYESDKVLSRLGKATVEQTDISQLIKDSHHIFNSTLRPLSISTFILPREDDKDVMYFKVGNSKLDKSDIPIKILDLGSRTDEKLIINPQNTSIIGKFMTLHGIEIIMRIKTGTGIRGYLFFGSKRSGLPYRRKDIRLLNTAADELALAIQNAMRFEEIRAFNRTLQDKVEAATARLRHTNARLRELDDAKDEFVSMASHQLRTPLTSVKGYLSMVLEGDAGRLNKEQKRLLEEAYSGAQRMVFLIGDFLNVSRIKTGKFMLEFVDSNLADDIRDEVDQLRITAENRNLNFIYDAPQEFPTVRLDENKIRQVAMNLIDNAIFYTKPGGTIRIELFVQDDNIIFRVRDNGIGVPESEQKGLFEKFHRATNARKMRPDGTGLGLFMIKKVVLAHGGSIIFSSKEGEGSTFGFRLPIKKRTSIKKPKATQELVK